MESPRPALALARTEIATVREHDDDQSLGLDHTLLPAMDHIALFSFLGWTVKTPPAPPSRGFRFRLAPGRKLGCHRCLMALMSSQNGHEPQTCQT